MKFMFFEVFLYYKKRTSSTVYMEFSSQFKNKMETTTTTRSAFFLRMADLDTTFTTYTVSRNMPKTGKKKQLSTYFFINKKQKLRIHFFQKLPRATI